MKLTLKYQPVIQLDGTVAIHETLVDDSGVIQSATYEPIRLEAVSLGDMSVLIRSVAKALNSIKPISVDELEALMYSVDKDEFLMEEEDDNDNVIDLVSYFSNPN